MMIMKQSEVDLERIDAAKDSCEVAKAWVSKIIPISFNSFSLRSGSSNIALKTCQECEIMHDRISIPSMS